MRNVLGGLLTYLVLVPGLEAQAPALKKPAFDSGGAQIHYTVLGKEDGEPVLLIHGFTATGEMFAPLTKALAKDYKVILIDCRGHGGSEKPHDPKKYGLEMVKDAVRLLDHLKIDKAHVAGYSMGSMLTLQLVVRYPDRLRSAVLAGAGLPTPGREKLFARLADSLEQDKGLAPLIIALTPKGAPKPGDEEIKTVDAFLRAKNDTKALAAVIRGLANKDLAVSDDQIKAIKIPMTALIGEVDPLREGVEALKKLRPDVPVVVIDKADHITAFSRPEFVDGVKRFLDAQRAKKKE